MFTRAALGGIWLYQRYVSPHKGFRCAHSVVHGDAGCSGYAKHTIRQHGLFQAIPIMRQRLRDCKAAYNTLRERKSADEEQKTNAKKSDSCAKQSRDGCCDAVAWESCDGCLSSAGRIIPGASKPCDADCDFCSCF
ncbi:hypothetical protein DS901_13460 [Loktanella sp. D2R18]|uniref:membrane protein insertion efficiency factor YidD n=1 Tax=Rhodobacterales TaxID=204455 RepID=UPI000DE93A18|nr:MULTISPECIES: membrane protein insertion efficiency factor YidD [Rhodobacterales]MDO6589018.1 membrane protein insertion efficiency factor YidD [Yoonia sp. 1_MG-2023]RBW41768.1 hypothetical protein DS901_13460 [Loktanella sp. D2R18]